MTSLVPSVDAAYAETRRRGSVGTVTQLVTAGADPKTGVKTQTTTTTRYRWMVKEPTKHSRWVRANMVQQDIGDVTFLMWVKDNPAIRRLRREDVITYNSVVYQVVSSTLEDNAFIVTSREVVK